jgi:hypothetical protein
VTGCDFFARKLWISGVHTRSTLRKLKHDRGGTLALSKIAHMHKSGLQGHLANLLNKTSDCFLG